MFHGQHYCHDDNLRPHSQQYLYLWYILIVGTIVVALFICSSIVLLVRTCQLDMVELLPCFRQRKTIKNPKWNVKLMRTRDRVKMLFSNINNVCSREVALHVNGRKCYLNGHHVSILLRLREENRLLEWLHLGEPTYI